MTKSTIENLPGEIEAIIPEKERTPLINQIIAEAKAGEFHDFKNEKYICGKVQLVKMLGDTKDPRLSSFINAIMRGQYDESPTPEDKIRMKKEWIENGSSPESFDKLFGKP